MVLRKPYAFFISIFKPIHVAVAITIAYLIYLNIKILKFLNTYMYSSNSVIGESIKSDLINNFLFIIPVFIILISLIIIGIMVRKKKSVAFYLINIFLYIVVVVISLYTSNFLGVMQESIVSVRVIKLMHDLVLINILIESVTFIFFIIRGLALNLKKFNFDSEISEFDVSESDKEEFEFDINVDLSEARRKRKKNLRFIKYKYLENRFKINIIITTVLALIIGLIIFIISSYQNIKKEGNVYTVNTLNIGVDNTMILNSNFKGEKITEGYLIVVNCRMQSFDTIYLNDFNLKIGDAKFKPTTKYSNYLIDIGNAFEESQKINEYRNYLFVYEIPEKFVTSDMTFNYSNQGKNLSIKINPINLVFNELTISKGIKDELSFADSLGNISFKINDYEIKNSYLFEYKYCIKDNDCIASKEYIKPSINTNFDKVILKLNVNYIDNSNLNINNFYSFFDKFGSIQYKIGDNWYLQSANFEELKSSKVNTKNDVYIGVNSNIINAESIKLIFNIRNSKYEYLLK